MIININSGRSHPQLALLAPYTITVVFPILVVVPVLDPFPDDSPLGALMWGISFIQLVVVGGMLGYAIHRMFNLTTRVVMRVRAALTGMVT